LTRNVPGLFQAHLDTGCTTVCTAWRVQRQDGIVMGFTDHDEEFAIGGTMYQPLSAFSASAVEDQLGLAVSNVDILGAISSDYITNDDLEAGRYDEASLTIFACNYTDADNQHATIRRGTLGQCQIGDLAFQAELRGLVQAYAQYIGALCSPKCRVANLGDTGSGLEGGCNFAMPAPVDAVVVAVTNRTQFQVSAAGAYPDGTKGSLIGGYFAFGYALSMNGKNIDLSREIADSDPSLNITLTLPMPFDIQIGDTFQLQIGCDKTSEVCRINFDNLNNLRAEPYVPGSDQTFQVNGE
jgi:uncharacterized phage protein (TIGR02218 family)